MTNKHTQRLGQHRNTSNPRETWRMPIITTCAQCTPIPPTAKAGAASWVRSANENFNTSASNYNISWWIAAAKILVVQLIAIRQSCECILVCPQRDQCQVFVLPKKICSGAWCKPTVKNSPLCRLEQAAALTTSRILVDIDRNSTR